ncbi:hypothetical protein [Pseudoalteromonas umbrosa]|uniref:hypothetical protein n=1 Tax=Pseudoalteromonas umbrosa TaxID=3048489 RepID=UPI0024C37D73|nr:hypothetical protein [Pseudoalteromonas sp. B95]MDK1290173.1 hypothetical protein [Pseudoalteromonas sp. B95]
MIGEITPELWSPSQAELDLQAEHGLLSVRDETLFFKCIRSGGCCKTNLCPVGELDQTAQQCRFLHPHKNLDTGHTLYRCTIAHEQHTQAACQISKGCCMPWSQARNDLLNAHKSDLANLIAVLNIE